MREKTFKVRSKRDIRDFLTNFKKGWLQKDKGFIYFQRRKDGKIFFNLGLASYIYNVRDAVNHADRFLLA